MILFQGSTTNVDMPEAENTQNHISRHTGDPSLMIRSHFEDLRRLKEFREKRDLSIRTISTETGLSQGALLRVKNLSLQRVYFSTLETLCRYFEVTSLNQLIEFVPEESHVTPPNI